MNLSRLQWRTNPDFLSSGIPREALKALEDGAGSNLFSRASQDDERAPVIVNIAVRSEGEIASVRRKTNVFYRVVAIKDISNRKFHLRHLLGRQPTDDRQRRTVGLKIRGLHVGDLRLGSTIVSKGPCQVARRKNGSNTLRTQCDG